MTGFNILPLAVALLIGIAALLKMSPAVLLVDDFGVMCIGRDRSDVIGKTEEVARQLIEDAGFVPVDIGGVAVPAAHRTSTATSSTPTSKRTRTSPPAWGRAAGRLSAGSWTPRRIRRRGLPDANSTTTSWSCVVRSPGAACAMPLRELNRRPSGSSTWPPGIRRTAASGSGRASK